MASFDHSNLYSSSILPLLMCREDVDDEAEDDDEDVDEDAEADKAADDGNDISEFTL